MGGLKTEERDGVLWIFFAGDLDQDDILRIKAEFDAAVAGADGDVVIHLGDVSFIGTLGLGLMIEARTRLAKQDRTLRLAAVPDFLEETLSTMSLDEVFDRVE